jgi:hypothetical protein
VIELGAVIEIRAPSGLAYAHYTHKHPQYGALLRVFSRKHAARPAKIADAVSGPPDFECFFPLEAAVRRRVVAVAGHVSIPEEARAFPTFRNGIPDREGRVLAWWLWDGEHERRLGELTDDQRRLSILGTINDTLLIERVESGWRPEVDPR